MKRALSLLALSAAPFLTACEKAEGASSLPTRAELGIFYGGEVQERREVSMPKDRPRPTLGFRLTWAEALPKETAVHWEIDMPGPADRRVQSVGEAKVPTGQARFDQVIPVPEGAPLGLWNVRVLSGEHIVVDRALVLSD